MNEKLEEKKPEFQKFLETLRGQIQLMEDNAESISHKVSLIQDTNEIEKGDDETEKALSTGLLSELWYCLGRMSEVNRSLEKTKRRLIDIVG